MRIIQALFVDDYFSIWSNCADEKVLVTISFSLVVIFTRFFGLHLGQNKPQGQSN